METRDIVLGIDLGTSNSGVAIIDKDGYPVMLENSEGKKTIPSIVAYKDGKFIVGDLAKRQMAVNSDTILSVKRSMGTNEKFTLGGKSYSPEEISSKILKNIKEYAEKKLGHSVSRAVITVPAYFNDAERRATKIAAQLAGLTVEKIINEPTAAALAYGIRNTRKQKILVVDFGGGTLDVSVLRIGDGTFEVIATSGDNKLGGDDLDQVIIDWIATTELNNSGVDLRNDSLALQRLKEGVEKAKIELSFSETSNISLPFIASTSNGSPINIDLEINRKQFIELAKPVLERIPAVIQQAIDDSGFSYLDMNEVLLVGGSTRIPAVQKLIERVTGRPLNHAVNPYEAVALGAAVQGGVISGDIQHISLLLDVTPLTLSIETADGYAEPIIPRNTKIPTFIKEIFTTESDNQESVSINILQGERPRAKDNKSLGIFELSGIEKAPAGVPQIEVEFTIDIDGILSVKAKDLNNGKSKTIQVKDSTTSSLSEEEVYSYLQEANSNRGKDSSYKMEVRIQENMRNLPRELARIYAIEEESIVSTEHKEFLDAQFKQAEKMLGLEEWNEVDKIIQFLNGEVSRIGAEIGYFERRQAAKKEEEEKLAKEKYWDNLFKSDEELALEEQEQEPVQVQKETNNGSNEIVSDLMKEINALKNKLNKLESEQKAQAAASASSEEAKATATKKAAPKK